MSGAEILYRFELLNNKNAQFLTNIDAQSLKKHIAKEELKLRLMQHLFMGAIPLFRLQQKLIEALNKLLAMFNTPTLMQDIQFQLMKITDLNQDVNREVARADRHQRIAYEQEMQRLKAHNLRYENKDLHNIENTNLTKDLIDELQDSLSHTKPKRAAF